MTIEINRPELEALIQRRLDSGQFQSVEDVLWQALASAPNDEIPSPAKRSRPEGRKSLAELFAESPFKGLAMDFERFPDILPPVDL
jgi:hypothetical protein